MTIFQFSFGDGYSGSAKIALLSSKLLMERKNDVVIFLSKGSLTEKRAGEYGLNYIGLDEKLKYKLLLKQISQYYQSYNPSIIIGHHSLDRKIGISLKRKYPEVINIAYRHNISKSLPVIGSFIYNRYTDYLIACSKGVENSLIKSGIKKYKVKTILNGIEIPQGLDKIDGHSIREKYHLDDKIVLGLSTWFHKERKGFDILFQAFSSLDNKYILFLVGIPQDQQNEVLSYAGEFGISPDRIVLPGYVENIWEYYKAMDIFLLTSRSEGFSLALLEAAAADLPIIASDIPGNNEFIRDNENGMLFDVNEPGKLADLIKLLNENKTLSEKLRKESKNEVISLYTIERYADNLNQFLRTILPKKTL